MADSLKTELKGALAEGLVMALFVFFGAGSVSAAVNATGGVVEPVNYALAFGLAITVLAYAVGDLSGGHINPAVTLAMAVSKNISPRRAALYFVAQFAGSAVGGLILSLCVKEGSYNSGIALSPNVTPIGGLLFEFMGTFLLLFTVFHVAVWSGNPEKTDLGSSLTATLAPIPIGFSVLVSHLSLGPFTGCGINPARVVGAVIWQKDFFETDAGEKFWIYLAGPFAASIAAPLVYFLMYGHNKVGNTTQEAANIMPM